MAYSALSRPHSFADECCRRCKRFPVCRIEQTACFRFRRALDRNVCRRIAKTHCEKKDRDWGTQPSRPPELPAGKDESFYLSERVAEFVPPAAAESRARPSHQEV